MFAIMSNGILYNAYMDCNRYYISSRKKERIDSGFMENKPGFFRKEIDLRSKEVAELFDIGWYVLYDVKLPGVHNEWRINKEDIDFENHKVTLWGYNYEGWEFRERGVSCKEFDYDRALGQYITKIIFARGGIKYPDPLVERTDVTKEEFMLAMQFYDRENF